MTFASCAATISAALFAWGVWRGTSDWQRAVWAFFGAEITIVIFMLLLAVIFTTATGAQTVGPMPEALICANVLFWLGVALVVRRQRAAR